VITALVKRLHEASIVRIESYRGRPRATRTLDGLREADVKAAKIEALTGRAGPRPAGPHSSGRGKVMTVLLVGYDLNAPGQRYNGLITELKSFGTYWHHLDSTWLVKAGLTAVEMRDRLKSFVDSGDELLVTDVSGDEAAWVGFSQRASDWLKANL